MVKNHSVIIIDEKIETKEKLQKVISSKEFISKMINAKKQEKISEMQNKGVSKEMAETTIEMLFDDKQDKIEEIVAPTILTDMTVNFRRYYEELKDGVTPEEEKELQLPAIVKKSFWNKIIDWFFIEVEDTSD